MLFSVLKLCSPQHGRGGWFSPDSLCIEQNWPGSPLKEHERIKDRETLNFPLSRNGGNYGHGRRLGKTDIEH